MNERYLTEKARLYRAMVKARPTSGPPRRGLIWNPSSHRWIRPPEPTQMSEQHLGRHAKQLTELARVARQHLEEADTPHSRRAAQHAHDNIRSHQRDVHQEISQRTGRRVAMRKIAKQGPPGPPPHPGLKWKPETHRWIKPESVGQEPIRFRGYEIPREEWDAMTVDEKGQAKRDILHARQDQRSQEMFERVKEIEEEEMTDEGQDFMRSLEGLRKEVQDPFAVATAQAQDMGHEDFSEGSAGAEKRDEIAESLKMIKALEAMTNQCK